MIGRNNYRVKKSPLDGSRRRVLFVALVGLSVFVILYGTYLAVSFHPNNGKKIVNNVVTGDQPLKQQLTVYIVADGGLSLRADHASSAARLLLVPNGTKLVVNQELEGWYQVDYSGKTGWISKQYTTTTAPAADPAVSWAVYTFKSGAKIKYEPGWSLQDYATNGTNTDTVAFSNQALPATLPAGSDFIAPIVVNFSSKTADDSSATYTGIGGVVAENLTVAGATAKKFTYTSPTSNTQVTSVVLASGTGSIVFSEAGGYADDLLKMLNTFTIN